MVDTQRATCEAFEHAYLGKVIPVLDHGFVRVVDYMGNDPAIVQAARVSYGSGTKSVSDDRGLIRYLMRHDHTTPFEMCEIKLHVKLPIFVARQWVRHRTANINEYSARYSVLDKEFYIPEHNVIALQSNANKQGRDKLLDPAAALNVREWIIDHSDASYNLYSNLNADEVARELTRMVLPVNVYTQWYWKIDLHNLMHFLRLRLDPHAQYEIRAYAQVLETILEMWVPEAWQAFRDYQRDAVKISRQGMEVIVRMLQGQPVTAEDVGMSKREWDELMSQLEDRGLPATS